MDASDRKSIATQVVIIALLGLALLGGPKAVTFVDGKIRARNAALVDSRISTNFAQTVDQFRQSSQSKTARDLFDYWANESVRAAKALENLDDGVTKIYTQALANDLKKLYSTEKASRSKEIMSIDQNSAQVRIQLNILRNFFLGFKDVRSRTTDEFKKDITKVLVATYSSQTLNSLRKESEDYLLKTQGISTCQETQAIVKGVLVYLDHMRDCITE